MLCVIFGNPVSHSKSPLIHNHLFKKYNFSDYTYEAYELYDISAGIDFLKQDYLCGASITIPFKIEVIPYLDEITELAEKIGAVNTVIKKDNKLIGDNTDAYGVIQAFKVKNINLDDKNIVVLGDGGVSRAVIYSVLSEWNINRLKIVGLDLQILNDYQNEIIKKTNANIVIEQYENKKYKIKDDEVIINATSIGMTPNIQVSLIDKNTINNNHIFFDVVYTPIKTQMIQDAQKKGCETISGINMFVYQALKQHFLWTGNEKATAEDVLEVLKV